MAEKIMNRVKARAIRECIRELGQGFVDELNGVIMNVEDELAKRKKVK